MPARTRSTKTPTFGIMALYWNDRKQLEERVYFAKLIRAAEAQGMNAFVFTPEDVRGERILAHRYDTERKKWSRSLLPFPDVIYDRCRYQATPRFRQLQQFRAKYPNLLYMNRPMANKWGIYQVLSRDPDLRKHLPDTVMVKRSSDVLPLLKRHGMIYTKPINGTGGRGILCIEKLGSGSYRVQGRNLQRRILHPRTCNAVQIRRIVAKSARKGNYLAQQGIDIRLSNGRVHDFRVLVQKDGQGTWQFTGGAARIGASGSITSNLHGGGRAMAMETLLEKRFGDGTKRQGIEREVEQFSFQVVQELERKYRDICEIALDLAIDRTGHIWLLEINPKPAREVFARVGKRTAYQTAVQRPIEYAKWLYAQRRG